MLLADRVGGASGEKGVAGWRNVLDYPFLVAHNSRMTNFLFLECSCGRNSLLAKRISCTISKVNERGKE